MQVADAIVRDAIDTKRAALLHRTEVRPQAEARGYRALQIASAISG